MRFRFKITHPGTYEKDGYTDTVWVTVYSVTDDSDHTKFASCMIAGMQKWYEGAEIKLDVIVGDDGQPI